MIIYEIIAYSEAEQRVGFVKYVAAPKAGRISEPTIGQLEEFDGEDTPLNALRREMMMRPELGKASYLPGAEFLISELGDTEKIESKPKHRWHARTEFIDGKRVFKIKQVKEKPEKWKAPPKGITTSPAKAGQKVAKTPYPR